MDAYSTGGVLSFLKNLPDPRRHNTRQSLLAVVTIALNLAKTNSAKIGVKSKRMRAGWDNQYLLELLAGGHTPEHGPALSKGT